MQNVSPIFVELFMDMCDEEMQWISVLSRNQTFRDISYISELQTHHKLGQVFLLWIKTKHLFYYSTHITLH